MPLFLLLASDIKRLIEVLPTDFEPSVTTTEIDAMFLRAWKSLCDSTVYKFTNNSLESRQMPMKTFLEYLFLSFLLTIFLNIIYSFYELYFDKFFL